MSNLSVPPFDLLSGQSDPYQGFGTPLEASSTREGKLRCEAEAARQRLEEGFGRLLSGSESIPAELDAIIDEMWTQGWNPDAVDLNLFATDFGLVLTVAVLESLGGDLVFRSEEDISHLSVWWSHDGLEAFPFHKVLKRLYSREGESLRSFVLGLCNQVSS